MFSLNGYSLIIQLSAKMYSWCLLNWKWIVSKVYQHFASVLTFLHVALKLWPLTHLVKTQELAVYSKTYIQTWEIDEQKMFSRVNLVKTQELAVYSKTHIQAWEIDEQRCFLGFWWTKVFSRVTLENIFCSSISRVCIWVLEYTASSCVFTKCVRGHSFDNGLITKWRKCLTLQNFDEWSSQE